ncbi:hypothetical protein [Nostoc sp. LPT]|uniref:hypothetical protein n=1 Tax=Nostoc sp. LPT TaxID=2815387 RepID=UPI001D4D6597|nr:hypothetical protein [Nostoc sp. LPT]MBN4005545.1 hypothetical protein [Nostoc sp. LPT]
MSKRRPQDWGDNKRTNFIDSPTQPTHPKIAANDRTKTSLKSQHGTRAFLPLVFGVIWTLQLALKPIAQETILGDFPWVRLLADS